MIFFTQLENLQEMYSEILMEVGSKDSKPSTDKNSQRAADMRGMPLNNAIATSFQPEGCLSVLWIPTFLKKIMVQLSLSFVNIFCAF